MPEKMTEVNCQLSDCMHHYTDPARPGTVFCKHTDKAHYMAAQPCPLFRLDWQKQAQAAMGLVKKLPRR